MFDPKPIDEGISVDVTQIYAAVTTEDLQQIVDALLPGEMRIDPLTGGPTPEGQFVSEAGGSALVAIEERAAGRTLPAHVNFDLYSAETLPRLVRLCEDMSAHGCAPVASLFEALGRALRKEQDGRDELEKMALL